MTQFEIIKPATCKIDVVQCEELREALVIAGLDHDAVDHGMVIRNVGIVVYEFALFVPPQEQTYFSIGHRLYAGNAVLYGVNEMGDTVDLTMLALPFWLKTESDVERAIRENLCPRPRISVNGDTLWEWPQPAPAGMLGRKR